MRTDSRSRGDIPGRALKDIRTFAKRSGIEKVILFGSRARGTNSERSDIDIAAAGGDFDSFYFLVKEELRSLLMVDIVDLDRGIPDELMKEIERDGMIIYEKT